MTAQLITSGQQKQIARFASDAADRACEELGLSKSVAQGIIERGDQLTFGIKCLIRGLIPDPNANLIRIDRSKPFDPVAFPGLGEGWSIAEEDERALALSEIDLNKIRLEGFGNTYTDLRRGDQKLCWLKDKRHIRLDAGVFNIFWKDQSLIPESWKTLSPTYIFSGTTLRHSSGRQAALCLYWFVSRWCWTCSWLDADWGSRYYLAPCLA